MAEKRMFAKSIVFSDAFLDMPMSARCLYFTLSMMADDDGFVGNPKGIMRQCGSSQDDLAVLIQKRFILAFDSGVIVIKHWRINNYLQRDRYKKTTYIEELNSLCLDEKNAYTEKQNNECIQSVYNLDTQYSKDKVSIDKNNIYIPDSASESVCEKQKDVKHKYGEYGWIKLTNKQYDKLIKDYGKSVIDNQIKKLDEYIQSNNNKNKYSDWNLVLRKSIRDNWFKSNNSQSNKNDGWCMRTEEELASEEPLPF